MGARRSGAGRPDIYVPQVPIAAQANTARVMRTNLASGKARSRTRQN